MVVKSLFNLIVEHGEGPVWDYKNHLLYWVDLLQGNFHIGNPATLEVETHSVGQPLGVLALREKGGLVMALRDGFALWNNGQLEFIQDPEADNKETRFNDGAVDPAGRFWAGTMSYDGSKAIGNLYCIDQSRELSIHERNLLISNGMAWSSNQKQYFLTDTFANVIYQYDYDLESGEISNRRDFIKFEKNEYPDGLTIDEEGKLWIAMWEGWAIWVYDKTGTKVNEIKLPVAYPTSCCFGGENMQTLFISTSLRDIPKADLPKQPLSGSILYLETEAKGLIEPYYAG